MITSEWPTATNSYSGSFVARQVDALRELGIEVDVFHFRGAKRLMNYLAAWRGVRARLAGAKYDLIHAQWGQSALLALPKRVPLVITYRGADLEGFVGRHARHHILSPVLRIISKLVAKFADEIIVVSEHFRDKLHTERCHVIPTGVNLGLFKPMPQAEARVQLGLPKERKLVLFAGSEANAIKRYGLAASAVSHLPAYLDAQLVAVSSVPHQMMPVYMNACDVLLVTSLHEGSPNVVKEALACQLPVVAVDVGDVRSRIEKFEECSVCDIDDPETIAGALESTLITGKRPASRTSVIDLEEAVIAKRVRDVYSKAVSRSPELESTVTRSCDGEC